MARLHSLGQLLRTLPHLRWEQIVYRPLRMAQYRAYRRFPALAGRWTNGSAEARGAASVSPQSAAKIASVVSSLPHLNRPLEHYEARIADLGADRFTLLNRSLTLDPLDWNRRYESHLWNYQLHYFNYAVWCARALAERGDRRAFANLERLVRSWNAEARPGRSDGWDAYPLSLRVVNWIYAYAIVAGMDVDAVFLREWSASIRRQLDFLRRHLEYHLLANHLLKNAKALMVGGLFCGDETLAREGERLVWSEMEEQVLEDGGHYERAPMYHALALADFLECYALARAFDRMDERQASRIAERLRAMAGFLEAMTWPDGTLALFNDSANAEEALPRPILDSCEQAGVYARESIAGSRESISRSFEQSGYWVWASAGGDERMIVDAGPLSVDYNAAHAHCDLLSYEMWKGGRPLVVDAGVHGYGGDAHREYARSTRAHNTVVFDGREQSEVWGTFRVARRAEVVEARAKGEGGEWEFRGAYRPYYDRAMIHERWMARSGDGVWRIADAVKGGRAREAESFIHLHPDVKARRLDGMTVECRWEGGRALIEPFGVDGVEIGEGWYFPDFGVAQEATVICLRARVREGEQFGYRISGAWSATSE